MSRVSTARLLDVGASIPQRERDLIRELDRLKLATNGQLTRLLPPVGSDAASASLARKARRILRQLTDLGALARLDRRVGGIRAGSAGYVYYLGPVGQRLVSYWNGQGMARGRLRPEPGSHYVKHRLAVTELYVRLREAERAGTLELLAYDVEPDSWRNFSDGLGAAIVVKPDAYLRLALGAYEDRYFIEVDLGSESRGVIKRKLRVYLSYFNSGHEQQAHSVFPRVLFVTNSEQRRGLLVELCSDLPAEAWRLFMVTTMDDLLAVVTDEAVDATDQAAALRGAT